ncbi:MAG TPA: chromosome partitioning protein ParB, partial [Candidatus Moranbacteria bacterium]|nr:chromosome partitioning protein ParB [Candidatus Moranbacteria bacterium]
MAQNYGLGRGLSSLIPSKKITDERSAAAASALSSRGGDEPIRGDKYVIEVDINNIVPNPHQPRIVFDDEKLDDLAKSIKQHGIIQPLIVSHNGAKYELIAGERRFQASKRIGLKKVPVVVREASEKDKLELAIVENVQRHD